MFFAFRKPGLTVLSAVLVSLLVSACNLEDILQQVTKGNVDSTAVARLKTYAGVYPVQALRGAHARGTLVLGADGTLDFDSAVVFAPTQFQSLVDTVMAGDTLGGHHFRVDVKPSNGAPMRRVKLYVDTTARVVLKAAYYPDVLSRPDSAVVVLRLALDGAR